MRKSTLNPNANEFKPRFNTQVSRTAAPRFALTCPLSLICLLCCLISPNLPTPPRPLGLRASPAPPSWSNSLCTDKLSASHRCILSHQSVLECRWDPPAWVRLFLAVPLIHNSKVNESSNHSLSTRDATVNILMQDTFRIHCPGCLIFFALNFKNLENAVYNLSATSCPFSFVMFE